MPVFWTPEPPGSLKNIDFTGNLRKMVSFFVMSWTEEKNDQ
jgi:hypothetical protein